MLPVNPDEALLTRAQTASKLTEAGFPVKPGTLATKASRGGGPAYELFGKKPLYRWGTALAWARSRLSAPNRTSSEHRAQVALPKVEHVSLGSVDVAETKPAP
jgi:hypothetical protein